jgi:hypothetical protein
MPMPISIDDFTKLANMKTAMELGK